MKFDGFQGGATSPPRDSTQSGAGRAGFDTRGYVSSGPEHVIENDQGAGQGRRRRAQRRKIVRRRPLRARQLDGQTFRQLRDAAPETDQPVRVTTMVLNLMERAGDPVAAMAELLGAHEPRPSGVATCDAP